MSAPSPIPLTALAPILGWRGLDCTVNHALKHALPSVAHRVLHRTLHHVMPALDRLFQSRLLLCTFSVLCLTLLGAKQSYAEQVLVAVAANFSAPMQQIAQRFERDTGHRARLSFGATGAFYAQIRHGAPFDVLLAADATTPRRLLAENRAVAGTAFTYARGRLVLWSAKTNLVDAQGAILKAQSWNKLAMANPQLAPYGHAAQQVLRNMGVENSVQKRLVLGSSMGQTYQFVQSGNADLGLVALAQVTKPQKSLPDPRLSLASGSAWLVPENLHAPILQDAVLLQRGAKNPAAKALLHYLRSESARSLIRSYGYTL